MSIYIFDGGLHEKDPSDILVYRFDWDYWEPLGEGVQIASVTHTITGPDAVLTKDEESFTDRTTTLRLSSGTVDESYEIACKIVTNETIPQTVERSFTVYVRQR